MKHRKKRVIKYMMVSLWMMGISVALGACAPSGASETSTEQSKEYPRLVVVNAGSYGDTEGFALVEEEINKITRKKLGVEVDFKIIGDDYNNTVELMLTGGEQVDILCASNTLFMKMYINRQLCDLEDLLEKLGR